MIVNVVEIFTEYLSVILCEHKIAKKKVALDRYFWMFFLLDLFSILLAHEYREEHGWLMMLVYVNFFVYVKMRLCKKWADAVKVFGGMLILIPSMQLIVYFSTKFIFDDIVPKYFYGVIVNLIVSVIILCWREKLLYIFGKKIKEYSALVIILLFILLFFYLLYAYKIFEVLYEPTVLPTIIGIIGISIICVLWINTENEKKRRLKELQLYSVYNNAFEDAILTIRMRQHEFDNHINAINCLQLTIDNPEELIKAQTEYCNKVLDDNYFNNLLKIHMNPILTGFLYSKFMNGKEQGITIIYDVHSIDVMQKVEITEFIEIIGILFDNAVEALRDIQDIERVLIIKILQEQGNKISIEVANRSNKYLNSEIEKFCVLGYSTKGKARGIGLARVKEIVKQHKADFYIENIIYNNQNFLSFKIIL